MNSFLFFFIREVMLVDVNGKGVQKGKREGDKVSQSQRRGRFKADGAPKEAFLQPSTGPDEQLLT